MLRFMSFSSGSCGNCYYLGSEKHGLLIDAGVSLKRLKRYLEENRLSYDSFSAIIITHDHLDHVRHLGSFCKRLSKPVYTTETLAVALKRHTFTSGWFAGCSRVLADDAWTDIDGIAVRYFVVPHDATQTVGYAIEIDGHSFVIVTDLGRVTDEMIGFASSADTVVVESNYDMDMLIGGSYTYELKMRIAQGSGHLSNDDCASAIKRFWHPGLKNIFLCHLSENNNTPEKAFSASSDALMQIGVERGTVALRCLPRRTPSPLYVLQD